jgi:membrane protein DedA with SNARE-associated domain
METTSPMDFQQYATAVVEFVKLHREWAEPIVFALAFGESLAFLSLLLPASVILFSLSTLIGASGLNFWTLWLAAGLGGSIGYALSYWFGYYFRDTIATYRPFSTNPELLPRGHAFFEKWGMLGVFFGHFFGPVRAVIPVVAGIVSMPHWQFQIANVTSAFLWAAGVLGPGAYGGAWGMKWWLGTS